MMNDYLGKLDYLLQRDLKRIDEGKEPKWTGGGWLTGFPVKEEETGGSDSPNPWIRKLCSTPVVTERLNKTSYSEENVTPIKKFGLRIVRNFAGYDQDLDSKD